MNEIINTYIHRELSTEMRQYFIPTKKTYTYSCLHKFLRKNSFESLFEVKDIVLLFLKSINILKQFDVIISIIVIHITWFLIFHSDLL